jgi:alcohol dehydrogenase
MHALVYTGVGQKEWRSMPDPKIIDPTDAIIRVDAVTICGTDLHILKGDVPEVDAGRVLGHEAVGTVVDVGTAVSTVRAGDRVLRPASPPAGGVATAGKGRTDSAWAVVAGCWVT